MPIYALRAISRVRARGSPPIYRGDKEKAAMSTISDTALRSVVGLVVVTAMFLAIWASRDTSARTGATTVEHASNSSTLYSARNDRAPVTRTSMTREQLWGLQKGPARQAP